MIQTADTDYVAAYDTDYEKPIKSRCFDKKIPQNGLSNPNKFSKTFF